MTEQSAWRISLAVLSLRLFAKPLSVTERSMANMTDLGGS
jgi:hypothetical protein